MFAVEVLSVPKAYIAAIVSLAAIEVSFDHKFNLAGVLLLPSVITLIPSLVSTSKVEEGLAVPMPTLPFAFKYKILVPAAAILNPFPTEPPSS